jgi:hypothetical protein
MASFGQLQAKESTIQLKNVLANIMYEGEGKHNAADVFADGFFWPAVGQGKHNALLFS